MSLKYIKSTPHKIQGKSIDRYDATIGPFFVGAQDNGEGWWNWWVALAEQGPAAGDHAILESGGNASWETARHSVERVLRGVANRILKGLK